MAQTSTSSAKTNDTQVGGTHYRDITGECPSCGAPIQHWDLFAKMPYLVGQVCKYVLRFQGKNGREDLEKAGHFLRKLIEVYYPNWVRVDPANPSLNPKDYAATPDSPAPIDVEVRRCGFTDNAQVPGRSGRQSSKKGESMTFQILDDKTGVWEDLLTLQSSMSIDVELILADFQKQLPDNKFKVVEDGDQK